MVEVTSVSAPAGFALCDVLEGEGTPVTVQNLKHELRTPINHIIGYSELLLDGLAAQPSSAERRAVLAIHAIGNDLLALTNAALANSLSPQAVASPDVLVALRAGVQQHVERLFAEGLTPERHTDLSASADIRKIRDAAMRLAEFARTGNIRNSEAP